MLEGKNVKQGIIIVLLVALILSIFLPVLALSDESISSVDDSTLNDSEEINKDDSIDIDEFKEDETVDVDVGDTGNEDVDNEEHNNVENIEKDDNENSLVDEADEAIQDESVDNDSILVNDEVDEDLSLERNVDIAPHVSNAPYRVIDMRSGANFAQTLAANSGNLVLVLHDNFVLGSRVEISGSRHIIITSAGTNLLTHTTTSTVFTINTGENNSDRHFWVTNGATLTLSNVVLNGGDWSGGTINRGGVRVTNGTLNMENGSVIQWCRGNNGGGVEVFNNGKFNMNGGLIANIRATNGAGVYLHGAGSVFNMSGGAIRNNTATNGGGVFIEAAGTFNMSNDTIRDNTATNGGGVFIQTAGTFNMNGGRIRSNSATLGGGVHVTDTNSTFRMRGGLIDVNVNVVEGGGVWVVDNARFIMEAGGTTAAPTSGRIADNNATGNDGRAGGGGVMVIDGGTFEMSAGLIERNSAIVRGGGINIRNAGATISNGTIRNNEVTDGNGAGIHLTMNSHVTIKGGDIINNTAGNQGGGLFAWRDSTITMDNGSIRRNTAFVGGGVGIGGNSTLDMNGGSIEYNTANIRPNMRDDGNGGGVFVTGGSNFNLYNGKVRNNIAGRVGGGIDISGGNFTMFNGEISGNEGPRGGGGIHALLSSVIVINNGEIKNNKTFGAVGRTFAGGGVALDASSFTMNNGKITGNVAIGNGGGIHVWNPNANNRCIINGGTISENTADNGGGIFVNHERNWTQFVTVGESVVFSNNVAQIGMQIDNELAQKHRSHINPSTVSVAGFPIFMATLENPEYFEESTTQHAFTNYDINAIGEMQFWRVTYEVGEGDGEISLVVGQNRISVPSAAFVSTAAQLMFAANPEARFIDWEIGTRLSERNDDGNQTDFTNQGRDPNHTLQYIINAHTHMIANFLPAPITTDLVVSKIVTGEFGNLTMDFDFTITFTDSSGNPLPPDTQFYYAGGVIMNTNATAPLNGTLKLNSEGIATFRLRHGQSITIADVPINSNVKVVETVDLNYVTSIVINNENEEVTLNNTTVAALTVVPDCTINFINDRFVPVPTGLDIGDAGAIWLLSLLIFSVVVVAYVLKRIFFVKKAPFRV